MTPRLEVLLDYRKEWRRLHREQDHVNAERVARLAGLDQLPLESLAPLPAEIRSKVNEFGRDWERLIAASANQDGFHFYSTNLKMNVAEVEQFHPWLENEIESARPPKFVSLFFESEGAEPIANGAWNARFYFALAPLVSFPSQKFADAPGVENQPEATEIR
ncbi:MAG: hypothetical protein H7301_11740 [Cryobacterium sp.]|nr:hypothetical protein [Oligoflexia bacterium]